MIAARTSNLQTQNLMDNITNDSNKNIKPPNTEPDHWLYCPSGSVFGGLMFVLLSLVILSIRFCVWRFDVRAVIIGYIVHQGMIAARTSNLQTQNLMDNITNHSSTNIKPPNTEPDGQYVLCLEV
jgi:hypothetical protein